jgi:hypothetical protein
MKNKPAAALIMKYETHPDNFDDWLKEKNIILSDKSRKRLEKAYTTVANIYYDF